MRAVILTELGSLEALKVVQIDTPRPGAGEALVKVEAAGVHPIDVQHVLGHLSRPTLPRIMGRDYAGTVVAGPAEWLGKRVFGTGGELGTTAQGTLAGCVVVAVRSLVELPEGLTFSQAGCLGVSTVAAWRAVFEAADTRAGHTLMVLGATGGVGSVALQLGRWTGARVIAVVRTQRQAAAARELGAREVLVGALGEIPAQLAALEGGPKADAVIDTIGGASIDTALACLAPRGRAVLIAVGDGKAGGLRHALDLRALCLGERTIVGVSTLLTDATASAGILSRVMPAIRAGGLSPGPIAQEVPLAEAAEAFADVAQGVKGRVVVLPQR